MLFQYAINGVTIILSMDVMQRTLEIGVHYRDSQKGKTYFILMSSIIAFQQNKYVFICHYLYRAVLKNIFKVELYSPPLQCCSVRQLPHQLLTSLTGFHCLGSDDITAVHGWVFIHIYPCQAVPLSGLYLSSTHWRKSPFVFALLINISKTE